MNVRYRQLDAHVIQPEKIDCKAVAATLDLHDREWRTMLEAFERSARNFWNVPSTVQGVKSCENRQS